MSSNMYRRIPLLVIGVLALLALSSASAFAASKPFAKYISFEPKSLTTSQVSGTVNPGGAATTYWVEYGTTEALGSSTPAVSVGSGTTAVAVNPLLKGFWPETHYYVRLAAKNSFGTSYSSIGSANGGEWWVEGTKPVRPAEYWAEKGSFAINFDPSKFEGHDMRIACESTGGGVLANWQGSGDEYNIHPFNCGVFKDGVKQCSASMGSNFPLDGRLVLSGGKITVANSCFLGEEIEFAVEPFTVKYLGSPWKHEPASPMELSATAKFGAYTVTITDTSIWALGGVNLGNTFGMSW